MSHLTRNTFTLEDSRFKCWYVISENNTGGYYCNPGNCAYVAILAEDTDDAWRILKEQSWYTNEFCSCCGERWGSFDILENYNFYNNRTFVIRNGFSEILDDVSKLLIVH